MQRSGIRLGQLPGRAAQRRVEQLKCRFGLALRCQRAGSRDECLGIGGGGRGQSEQDDRECQRQTLAKTDQGLRAPTMIPFAP